jgi:hypothetical protein
LFGQPHYYRADFDATVFGFAQDNKFSVVMKRMPDALGLGKTPEIMRDASSVVSGSTHILANAMQKLYYAGYPLSTP